MLILYVFFCYVLVILYLVNCIFFDDLYLGIFVGYFGMCYVGYNFGVLKFVNMLYGNDI